MPRVGAGFVSRTAYLRAVVAEDADDADGDSLEERPAEHLTLQREDHGHVALVASLDHGPDSLVQAT